MKNWFDKFIISKIEILSKLWYKIIRLYVKLGLRSYFQKTLVFGLENIPKDEPILFVGNHRNGLIDPIMIATTNPRVHLFLTRASAFKNKIANILLRSINMIPIYRIRDGLDRIEKNQAIFEACHREFKKKGSVLIFPEGNHGLPRRVRQLTKGFARIAFGYFDSYPNANLYIVPVGLNYSNMQEKGSAVAVYYGKAISVRDYYNTNNQKKAIDSIKEKVYHSLKELTTQIDDLENHTKIERVLASQGIDFLNPIEANNKINEIENWDIPTSFPKHKNSIYQNLVSVLFKINTFLPILLWRCLKNKPKDIVLIPTFLFGLSLGLLPLYYLLISGVISYFINPYWGFVYFISSILLVLLYKNSIYTDSLTTNLA